ncbi:NUDIX domain-containing protein [Streptomyces sp. NPDC006992]|uniref:NUDIX domain-containing protein n=1 Tax=unclassified Streptomyces TaxID=2593676 RepID=UPI0033E376F7
MSPAPRPEEPPAPPSAPGSLTLLGAAVVVHDPETGRILLLQRGPDASFAPGMWDIPGGKSEPGEPVTGTAVRELTEETGLTVRPEHLRLAHLTHGARTAGVPHGFLTVVFAARTWSGTLENREPDKHPQVRWVDPRSLPEPLVPSTATALRGYLDLADGPGIALRGW